MRANQPCDANRRRVLPREYKINLLENNVKKWNKKMRFGGELPGPGFLVKSF